MNKKVNKILIISLQGIGDLLLTTPLLYLLRKNFLNVKLYVLTLRSNKEILFNNPNIDEIIAFDSRDRRNIFKILILLFNLRREYFDLTICAYPSGLRSAFLGYLSGAAERFGQDLSLFKNYRWLFTKQTLITEVKHAVLMNLDFLKLLNINIERINTNLVLNLTESDKRFASEFLKANNVEDGDLLIAIHPGGGKFTATYRCWPEERFAKVADNLAERHNAKILLIGGKDDKLTEEKIISMMKHKPIGTVGRASIKQTAALIQKARLLICNNSAPMHIAAALGIPTVSIFGSADPRIHRPWGKNHIILQKELECSPCYYPFFRDTLEETKLKNRWLGKRFKCVTNDYRCLSAITVEDVLRAVDAIFIEGSYR